MAPQQQSRKQLQQTQRQWSLMAVVSVTAAFFALALAGCAGTPSGRAETTPFSLGLPTNQQGTAELPVVVASGPDAPLPEEAKLEDYVRYALGHHPDLDAAFQQWRAAVERIPQAQTLPDPRVSVGFILDQVDSSAEYMGEQYTIEQMFPWFGTLALGGNMAMARAHAEAQRYEATRLQVVDQVSRAYHEYAFQCHAVLIARENLDLLVELEAVTRTMFRTGAATLADVNRAQIEIGRLDDQVRSLEDLVGVAAAELNAALGRSAHATLPATPVRPTLHAMAALPAYTDAQWLSLARQDNPELVAARYDAEQQNLAIALARKSYYPDVAVGVEYARDGSARLAMMDQGGSDMLAGMISINVPIWRGKYDAEVREAQALASEVHRRIESREIRLEADLKRALVTHRDSLRKLELYGQTLLPMARQTRATTEMAYRAGTASFSDLIDTQRVLLEFALAHERAATDQAQAHVRIQALIGGRPNERDDAGRHSPTSP
jgi:outer membrane protein, heavy metal efflux system